MNPEDIEFLRAGKSFKDANDKDKDPIVFLSCEHDEIHQQGQKSLDILRISTGIYDKNDEKKALERFSLFNVSENDLGKPIRDRLFMHAADFSGDYYASIFTGFRSEEEACFTTVSYKDGKPQDVFLHIDDFYEWNAKEIIEKRKGKYLLEYFPLNDIPDNDLKKNSEIVCSALQKFRDEREFVVKKYPSSHRGDELLPFKIVKHTQFYGLPSLGGSLTQGFDYCGLEVKNPDNSDDPVDMRFYVADPLEPKRKHDVYYGFFTFKETGTFYAAIDNLKEEGIGSTIIVYQDQKPSDVLICENRFWEAKDEILQNKPIDHIGIKDKFSFAEISERGDQGKRADMVNQVLEAFREHRLMNHIKHNTYNGNFSLCTVDQLLNPF